MKKIIQHPGKILEGMLNEKEMSQRELASKIDVAHSLLSNILSGNRNISTSIALSLEAVDFKTAKFWLTSQVEYSLEIISKENKNKNDFISLKNDLEKLVPIQYFNRLGVFNFESPNDIKRLFSMYKVDNINSLEKKVHNFEPKFFRKSSKFAEDPKNVFAWSVLAEYEAKKIKKIGVFDIKSENLLIDELNKCFYKNKNTIVKTQKILNKYGIKFFTLDRPTKTPVEGKSFMSGNNPTIVLTLKYKRLDNFAFTLMHELGHVFKHLTNPKYKDESFFTLNKNTKEEREADNYAQENVIKSNDWNNFIYYNNSFTDEIIKQFSKKIEVHPAIIRGRVCFENPSYYRKRTSINKLNKLNID